MKITQCIWFSMMIQKPALSEHSVNIGWLDTKFLQGLLYPSTVRFCVTAVLHWFSRHSTLDESETLYYLSPIIKSITSELFIDIRISLAFVSSSLRFDSSHWTSFQIRLWLLAIEAVEDNRNSAFAKGNRLLVRNERSPRLMAFD